jgi:hypothetical protein
MVFLLAQSILYYDPSKIPLLWSFQNPHWQTKYHLTVNKMEMVVPSCLSPTNWHTLKLDVSFVIVESPFTETRHFSHQWYMVTEWQINPFMIMMQMAITLYEEITHLCHTLEKESQP